MTTLFAKKNYIVHYGILKIYLCLSIKLINIHRASKFCLKPWLIMTENFSSGNQEEQISFVSDVSLDRDENGTPRNTLDKQCFRMMTYEFDCRGNTHTLSLDTLLDTRSPIGFIKKSLVQGANVRPYAPESSREYSGINESTLIQLGVASVRVTLDSVERKFDVFVVPDRTMRTYVILVRDALNKFNLRLIALPEKEADAIREIFGIDIPGENAENFLQINPKMDVKFHLILKDLFISE